MDAKPKVDTGEELRTALLAQDDEETHREILKERE
jgi:hypothetical protein